MFGPFFLSFFRFQLLAFWIVPLSKRAIGAAAEEADLGTTDPGVRGFDGRVANCSGNGNVTSQAARRASTVDSTAGQASASGSSSASSFGGLFDFLNGASDTASAASSAAGAPASPPASKGAAASSASGAQMANGSSREKPMYTKWPVLREGDGERAVHSLHVRIPNPRFAIHQT